MKNENFEIKIDAYRIEIVLFILFLILRLDNIIQWKWVWVFSPIWISWAIWTAVYIVTVIVNVITYFVPRNLAVSNRVSGPRLVWDAKTNTMYGPFDGSNNEEVQ